MATESPMRMMESGGGRNWPSSKAAAAYVPPLSNMAAEELGMILKGHRRQADQRNMVPNRSGSAPPSMEGSLEAFGNLMAQQSSILNSTLPGFESQTGVYESEEKLRADPAYLAYYYSNVNLNPRLPPPMISRENQRLVSHVAGFGGNRRLPSFDDSGKGSLHFTRASLSTHKEEPEDERSPRQSSDDCSESSNLYVLEHNAASLATRHKSLVDLIQADFPRTPSPLYSQSHSLSPATAEETVDHDDVQAISMKNLTLDVSKSAESKLDTVDACGDGIPSIDNPSITTKGKKVRSPNSQNADVDGSSRDKVLAGGVSRSEAFSVQENKSHNLQRGATYQVQGPQVSSQGTSLSRVGTEKFTHGYSKISNEMLTVPRPPGLAPPAYASPTAYVTAGHQFLPGLHPPGVYSPQYNVGGYALSSAFLPPFIAGYPSLTGMPMQYDAISGQSFSGRTAGVSTGEGIPHAGDLQQMQKLYGQQGLLLQPSFMDPIQMQYLQQSAEDVYGASGQYGWFTSLGSLGGQVNSYPSPKEAVDAAYRGDKKFVPSPNGSVSTPSPRIAGITGSSYYSSPPNMGVMTQFPVSPLGSPLLPGSPVGGVNHAGWRSEFRFSPGSSRSTGAYSPWHGHRGNENSSESRRQSFLEELKSSHAHRIDLSDIAGHIIELSMDQHGSRFIQQKLENCGIEEKASVFQEVLPNALKLMTDVFGNYVIQKFFEHGTREQRKELAGQLSGQMLPLSLQMYGCRVIQKALEVIELDQKAQLVHELDGHVMRCVRDQNGNHVIQKCIECVSPENIGFILAAFEGQVATLSTHPYGCRVIQRVLEHCSDDSQSQCIVNEILESSYILAQDQYGNYVTQHVLERGKPQERSRIISKLTGKIVQLSQHKYASNVVEKCLEYGDAAEREALIEEVVGPSEENDNLLAMMKDQFANYVVQKILEKSDDKQREALLRRIRIHLNALKKYTYGKHIVARFEQLFGEDNEALDTN